LFGDLGCSIEPSQGRADLISLTDHDIEQVFSAFRNRGLAIFRGFIVDLEGFRTLSERLCTNFRVHVFPGAREAVSQDQTIQTALKGNRAVPFHKELSFTPLWPDVVWFYCQQPPQSGTGETLVCDAVKLYEKLSAGTRRLFTQHRLRYAQLWTRACWQGFLRTTELEEACRTLASYPGVHLRDRADLNGSDTICVEYVVSAIAQTKFSSQNAFANSILMTARYGRSPSVAFENGAAIGNELRREIQEIANSITHKIRWEEHDVVLIDNSRVMHGRSAFSGSRIVLTRLADLKLQYADPASQKTNSV
jgi:alpha-ketoglutarate-dependent taurine dioxygenase